MAYTNIEDRRAYSSLHYEANKDIYKKRAYKAKRATIEHNQEVVLKYLLSNPCLDCNEPDPIVLEFDHRPGAKKTGTVSKMVRDGVSLKRIMEEIHKCDVRCANCHRRVTVKRRLEEKSRATGSL